MLNTADFCYRGLIRLVAILVAFSSMQSNISFAQVQDFEAPIIEIEEIESGELGDVQVISATVVDNDRVTKVTLHYRFSENDEFGKIVMQTLAHTSFFTAKIPTSDVQASKIEYYIRAEDAAGNTVFRGHTFDPLVRTLSAKKSEPITAETQTVSAEQPAEKKSKTLYYVLGALAVVALAGLAAGGGSGEGDPPQSSECDPAGCQVTFNLTNP